MGTRVARARAVAAWVVGARAGSVVEPLGLAGEEHEAALHCSTGSLTASTRATVAASPG